MPKQVPGRELQEGGCWGGDRRGEGRQREKHYFSSLLSAGVLLISSKSVAQKVFCCGAWLWGFELTDGEQARSSLGGGSCLISGAYGASAWVGTRSAVCSAFGEILARGTFPSPPSIALAVLAWCWLAVTSLAELSACRGGWIILPNARAEGFAARGWLGAVHGLRLGCWLPRQSLSNGHKKGWRKSHRFLQSGFHPFCLKTIGRGKHSNDGLALGRLASDLLNALGLIDLNHRV